ncbi:serine protease inhibitor precursor [Aphelenchoides avenae]|nr:serine protease inhibitor precursor [Aphelenchus avenae]
MNDYYCKDESAEKLVEQAYADTCPDGSKTRGVFGKNCKEMYCAKDENCHQVNKFFAKCCKNKN